MRIVPALACCFMLACSPEPKGDDDPIASKEAAASLGAFGIETANIDPDIDPGDDFHAFVNGRWLSSFVIPPEYSSYGAFTELRESSDEKVRILIENAAAANDPSAQQLVDFYTAYLDVEAINEKGLTPIEDDLARIASAKSRDDIAQIMSDPDLTMPGFIGLSVALDAKDPSQYALYISQSGLGMPNRTFYIEPKFAAMRAAYRDFIESMLTLSGRAEPERLAQAVFALETEMARIHWEPAKRRNRDLTYNPLAISALEGFAPGAPWVLMLETIGADQAERVILREDDAVAGLARLFAQTPVETWSAYLQFHLLRVYADVLPTAFDQAHFDFYGRTLNGSQEQRPRWKRAVRAVNDALGEAVGARYVDAHFPPTAKAQMDELVANLRAAFAERLAALDWMSDATKARARDKLEKFTPKIGYPERWRSYDGLALKSGQAYANAKAARAFAWREDIAKLGQPVDRTEWFMTPQTVNAYYSPTRNEIVFPAAILQPPFFDPNADPAVNYGAIGAVIGHEMGHGFDDQGRKSDGDGFLRDWWTPQDAAAFEARAAKLGAQYAQYEPLEGFPINPALSMGENIGDLGGVQLAYAAYRRSLGGEDAPVIGGYTGDQRFFMAWAQIWRQLDRDAALKRRIASGPHSPAKYRVNGVVRNIDAWYDAFPVSEDDALYLPPEARVRIW